MTTHVATAIRTKVYFQPRGTFGLDVITFFDSCFTLLKLCTIIDGDVQALREEFKTLWVNLGHRKGLEVVWTNIFWVTTTPICRKLVSGPSLLIRYAFIKWYDVFILLLLIVCVAENFRKNSRLVGQTLAIWKGLRLSEENFWLNVNDKCTLLDFAICRKAVSMPWLLIRATSLSLKGANS